IGNLRRELPEGIEKFFHLFSPLAYGLQQYGAILLGTQEGRHRLPPASQPALIIPHGLLMPVAIVQKLASAGVVSVGGVQKLNKLSERHRHIGGMEAGLGAIAISLHDFLAEIR